MKKVTVTSRKPYEQGSIAAMLSASTESEKLYPIVDSSLSVDNEDMIEPIIFDKPYGMKANLYFPNLPFETEVVEDAMVVMGQDNAYMVGNTYLDNYPDRGFRIFGVLDCPAMIGSSKHPFGLFIPFTNEDRLISYKNAYIANTIINDLANGRKNSIIDPQLVTKLDELEEDFDDHDYNEDDF